MIKHTAYTYIYTHKILCILRIFMGFYIIGMLQSIQELFFSRMKLLFLQQASVGAPSGWLLCPFHIVSGVFDSFLVWGLKVSQTH